MTTAKKSNVVQFVARAVTPPKTLRKSRKRISGKVLPFTGTKRFNYDREEVLKNWQEDLVAMTRKLHVDAINGSLTGLLYVRTLDGPDGEIDGDWSGLVCEDLHLTADILDQWAEHVEDVRRTGPRQT